MAMKNKKIPPEISRLQDILIDLANSADIGIKKSQASPKQLVETAFSICKSNVIKRNRSLHTRALSCLLSSDDPPDIISFLNKASINRRNSDKEMNDNKLKQPDKKSSWFDKLLGN